MKIEDQVCSLEPGKELKELGVKQDSLYSYFQYDKWNVALKETREIFSPDNECGYNKENLICSAFTVAEFCDGLPARIKTDYGSWSYLHITKLENSKEWIVTYFQHDEIKGSTLANACAKMLIYLLKNNVIEK